MRICQRCQGEMIGGLDVKVEGGAYGITIAKSTGVFAKRLGKPKVAICKECGEISLYMENMDELLKNER